jgi:hypothetical protein
MLDKKEILEKKKVEYNNLFVAMSIIPDTIPIRTVNAYTSSVYIRTSYVSEREYYKLVEDLTEYEIDDYNYIGDVWHGGKDWPGITVTHKKGNVYITFNIYTKTYHKFLHMISDGKCKITKEVVPASIVKERTITRLTCGG